MRQVVDEAELKAAWSPHLTFELDERLRPALPCTNIPDALSSYAHVVGVPRFVCPRRLILGHGGLMPGYNDLTAFPAIIPYCLPLVHQETFPVDSDSVGTSARSLMTSKDNEIPAAWTWQVLQSYGSKNSLLYTRHDFVLRWAS